MLALSISKLTSQPLATLYDVASALPYPDLPLQKLRPAMKFGGSYVVTSRSLSMWPRISKELGLPVDVVFDRAKSLMDRLPDSFSDVAHGPSLAAVQSELPNRLVDAVAVRIRQLRIVLERDR